MPTALALLTFSVVAGCGHGDLHAEAERLDRQVGTRVYTWLVEHDPSRLDIAGAAPDEPALFVPDGEVRTVSADVKEACHRARHDHALLLAFISARDERRREAALNCGFALERDGAALIIAPW